MAHLKIQDAISGDGESAANRAAALIPTAFPDGVGGWLPRRLTAFALVAALKGTTAPVSIGGSAAVGATNLWADAGHAHAPNINASTLLAASGDADQASWVWVTAKGAATTPVVPLATYKMTLASFFTSRTLTGCALVGGSASQTTLAGVKEQCRADITALNATLTGVSAGNRVRVLMSGAHTLTLPNLLSPTVLIDEGASYELTVECRQDAVGGRSITFLPPAGATLEWGSLIVPGAYKAPNSSTFFTFIMRRPRATEPDAGAQQWQGRTSYRQTFGWFDIPLTPTQRASGGAGWTSYQANVLGTIGFQVASGTQANICEEGIGHPNHDVVPGAPIRIHVHFFPLTEPAAGETAIFDIEYTYAAGHGEEQFSATTSTVSITHTFGAGTDIRRHFVTETAEILLPSWKPDGNIVIKITRRGDIDTHNGGLAYTRADVHAFGYLGTRLFAPVNGSFD